MIERSTRMAPALRPAATSAWRSEISPESLNTRGRNVTEKPPSPFDLGAYSLRVLSTRERNGCDGWCILVCWVCLTRL
jgi:hypothetical protein